MYVYYYAGTNCKLNSTDSNQKVIIVGVVLGVFIIILIVALIVVGGVLCSKIACKI